MVIILYLLLFLRNATTSRRGTLYTDIILYPILAINNFEKNENVYFTGKLWNGSEVHIQISIEFTKFNRKVYCLIFGFSLLVFWNLISLHTSYLKTHYIFYVFLNVLWMYLKYENKKNYSAANCRYWLHRGYIIIVP